MILRAEVEKYERLSGNKAENIPENEIRAYLAGHYKANLDLKKALNEIVKEAKSIELEDIPDEDVINTWKSVGQLFAYGAATGIILRLCDIEFDASKLWKDEEKDGD